MDYELICEVRIPGEPLAKERPRFGRGHAYTSARTKQGEEAVGWSVKKALPKGYKVDAESHFSTDLEFWCSRPKDGDNMQKLVHDALQGIVWANDRQVIESSWLVRKEPLPLTKIIIYRLDYETNW